MKLSLTISSYPYDGVLYLQTKLRLPELADDNAPDAQLARIAASAIPAPAARASGSGRSALDALMARLTELRGDLESGDALDAIFDEAACWLEQLTKGRTE